MPDTQITDEMVELGAQAAYEHEPIVYQCADIPWQTVSEGTRDRYRHKIRLALTAALSGHVVVSRAILSNVKDALEQTDDWHVAGSDNWTLYHQIDVLLHPHAAGLPAPPVPVERG